MNFAFFHWIHDELVALRAAVARLESHTGAPESKPAVKPELPAEFGPITPPGAQAPVEHPAEPPAAPVPVALPPGGNTTDPTAPGFIPPAQPVQPVPAAPAEPTVDTSADTLDFEAVRGRPIDLADGVAKTIVNCPPHVKVIAGQASGQTGAHNSYTVTVNGTATFMPNVENEYISSNYGTDVQGPTVTVSVDSPGLQMEIQ